MSMIIGGLCCIPWTGVYEKFQHTNPRINVAENIVRSYNGTELYSCAENDKFAKPFHEQLPFTASTPKIRLYATSWYDGRGVRFILRQ